MLDLAVIHLKKMKKESEIKIKARIAVLISISAIIFMSIYYGLIPLIYNIFYGTHSSSELENSLTFIPDDMNFG